MKNVGIVIGVIIVIALAYFGYRSYYPKNSSPVVSSIVTQTTSVEIKNMAFSPSNISVTVGQTVTFTNNDSITHTVTADDNSFDSGNVAPGATFTKTFETAGSFSYHCSIHPSMKGIVEVK